MNLGNLLNLSLVTVKRCVNHGDISTMEIVSTMEITVQMK